MDNTGFDMANWSHWLLLACCAATSIWGLVLSWQWNAPKETRRKWNKRMRVERKRAELTKASREKTKSWPTT